MINDCNLTLLRRIFLIWKWRVYLRAIFIFLIVYNNIDRFFDEANDIHYSQCIMEKWINNKLCTYRFHFKQIVDGNSKTDVSNRREPGMFCGEAEQPQTFISETSYVKVVFHTDNFTDQVRENTTLKLLIPQTMARFSLVYCNQFTLIVGT